MASAFCISLRKYPTEIASIKNKGDLNEKQQEYEQDVQDEGEDEQQEPNIYCASHDGQKRADF